MSDILKKIVLISSFSIILFLFDSCRLFDKELEQDRHIAAYRHQMLASLDSLHTPKERIASFSTILDSIQVNKALITPRKKNELIKNCYSFISMEYCELKDYDKAIDYSNIYIELDKKDARGYYNRGVANQEKGNDSLALNDYMKAMELNSKYTPAQYNMAIIYETMKAHDKAIAMYTNVIEMSPTYLKDAYINRGNVYMNTDNWDDALDDYTQAIKIDTTDIAASSNRGNVYVKLEQYAKAIEDYTYAMNKDSTSADIHNKRAYAYELSDEHEKALADYTKARKLNKSRDAKQLEMSKHGIERIKKERRKKK